METLTHPSPFRDGQSSNGATAADEPKRSSKRRKACNECKQQKLRCDLAAGDTCRRCTRLQLECKIEDGFRRTRKRRRSCDLENEIQELRAQLDQLRDHATPVSVSTLSQPVSALQWPVETTTNAVRVTVSYDSPARQSVSPSNPGPGPLVSDDSHVPSSSTTERAHLPNLTTRPGIDESVPRYLNTQTLPRPRALGNIVLSVEEIDELFNIYLTYHHPFLPLIDPSKSPHEYYQSSELLFWSILSVASRRLKSQPTLLPRLARNVPDLLWKTVRCVPYSVLAIQGIALLCTWPFPTSSSTTDPTFMLAGILLQTGTQMGLHRAIDAPDFSKIRRRLNIMEHAEWTRTWEACNIVAHSVSVGSGLPLIIQTYDWLQHPRVEVSPQENATGMSFTRYMRIERIRHRVSSSLAWHLRGLEVSAHEKLTLYRLLNSDFIALELEEPQDNSYTTWHLLAARLHLQAFFLLDDAALDGYTDRIITLYLTAYSLVEKSLWLDVHSNGFLEFCPFFCYQVFACASFVILKILSNGFFRSRLEIQAGTKLLESAIAALRKISVVNNDLPARLGDVIGFFCTLPDPTSVGGVLVEHVRLQKVRNRLSMSVVYDCLWTWRRHFQLNDDDRTSHNRFYCSDDKSNRSLLEF